MITIKPSSLVTLESINRLRADRRCKIGENISIEEGASIYIDSEFRGLAIADGVSISRGTHIEINRGAEISIGKNVTIGRDSVLAAMCSITIGDGAGIANGATIRDHNHRINSAKNIGDNERAPWASGFEAAPIVIEPMVIVSDGVKVFPGVRIGQNTIIGAGCYVRQSIAPNCKAVGNSQELKILATFKGANEKLTVRELKFYFFGDSLMDRPTIVVPDPHYDLPQVGTDVKILRHERGGFYKIVHERLKITFPEQVFSFQNFAKGGSTIRDVAVQVSETLRVNPYPDVSFVGVGINDIWRRFQGRETEAVGFDEFCTTYTKVIADLKERSRLVFCIAEPIVQVGDQSDAFNRILAQYNAFIEDMTKRQGFENVYFVDLYRGFERVHLHLDAYNPSESLWIDGIHLSSLGNSLAADLILASLHREEVQKKLFRLPALERDIASRRYLRGEDGA